VPRTSYGKSQNPATSSQEMVTAENDLNVDRNRGGVKASLRRREEESGWTGRREH